MENNKKRLPKHVKRKQEVEQKKKAKKLSKNPKWDDLKDLNLEYRNRLKELYANIAKLKLFATKKGLYDKEAEELYEGIKKSAEEIDKRLDELTRAHAKVEEIEEDGVKKLKIVFFTGPVDEKNEKEVQLYLDCMIGYAGIFEQISVLAMNSAVTFHSHIMDLYESQKQSNEQGDVNGNNEQPTNESNNSERTTTADSE